ncbi:FecR domain-containing protein [Sphingobium sp. EM0848]|uniref:FecR family protein n=1 Tax=Sphingobium sp. EM0848 TaxID=2743473 RepID=UPI00159C9767|nr:FecR domain-containing protein [Sphingobium sp. EM0848]
MTAQSDIDEGLIEQALHWQTTLESDDADWNGYMVWLEADPRHRDAFDAVALVAATVDEHKDAVRALSEAHVAAEARRPGRRMWLWGSSAAAALALVVGMPMLRAPETAMTYASDAEASRSVSLAGGTAITLSPASRIVVHGKDARRIEMNSGEAYFAVKHDPSRSLTVEVGHYRITDIGTHFSVNISDGGFRVAVSEGAVAVSSDSTEGEVKVTAGHQLMARQGEELALSPVVAAEIGSWRQGRLSYSNAPLSLVAADISRYSGKRIIVDPALEAGHFSGTLVIGDGSRLLADLAAVMDLSVHAEHAGNGDTLRLGRAGGR